MQAERQTYAQYLEHVIHIPATRVRYYKEWIRLFEESLGPARGGHGPPAARVADRETAIGRFRRRLTGRWAPWQVEQALHALRLFWFWVDGTDPPRRRLPITREQADRAVSEMRAMLRLYHRSVQTEKSYVAWLRRFLDYLGKLPEKDDAAAVLRRYLTYLAVERRVAASTQQQAFNALLFFYRHVLRREVDGLDSAIRARVPRRRSASYSPSLMGSTGSWRQSSTGVGYALRSA